MKKIVFFGIVVVSALVINNLVHSIYDLWKKKDLLVSAQKELDLEKQKNQMLKSQLKIVKTNEFVEQEARNKLFLVKEGEQEVLIQKDLLVSPSAKEKQDNSPNWKKWWELFF